MTELLPPKRYIFNQTDLNSFRNSTIRSELLRFVTLLGQSCASTPADTVQLKNPAIQCLNGSLKEMVKWIEEIPPLDSKSRFGNLAFRKWHERLCNRSEVILRVALLCHFNASKAKEIMTKVLLQSYSELGAKAASSSGSCLDLESLELPPDGEDLVVECKEYFESSFGNSTRIDYGTGHESFFIFILFVLFKTEVIKPNPEELRAVSLKVFVSYLQICRGLQTDYMLEPAGSHGVWGLDDYFVVAFYIGACQLIDSGLLPSTIHDRNIIEREHEKYLYFGCIRYIRSLKVGAPFAETSPMLNDISFIDTWKKVSTGLLRLYEGEVLDKLPVVQHFLFGKVIRATWSPSQGPPTLPVKLVLGSTTQGENASKNDAASGVSGMMPPDEMTVAPWAMK